MGLRNKGTFFEIRYEYYGLGEKLYQNLRSKSDLTFSNFKKKSESVLIKHPHMLSNTHIYGGILLCIHGNPVL